MQLTLVDWLVFCSYFFVLALLAWWVNQKRAQNSSDYFLGANTMPAALVAISVLATSQSAATFLGGPDLGFRGNLSYLAPLAAGGDVGRRAGSVLCDALSDPALLRPESHYRL